MPTTRSRPQAWVGPVSAAGEWLTGRHRPGRRPEHDGATGFWVVTPLEVCDQGCASLPVVIGWSPERELEPAAEPGRAEVTGWLQPGESAGLPDDDPADDVLPTLRIADLLQRVDGDLYGGYVILRTPAEARAGLEAVTPGLAAGAADVHRAAQPALRHRVVVLRRLRGLPVVAVEPRRARPWQAARSPRPTM